MSGLGTGRCGFSGCENPCPRDEDFCCAGCEEAQAQEDHADAEAAAWEAGFEMFGPSVVAAANELVARTTNPPSIRERIEALPRHLLVCAFDEDGNADEAAMVKLADVLALFDPECSLCEQGHVPARSCAIPASEATLLKLAQNPGATVELTAEQEAQARAAADAVGRRVDDIALFGEPVTVEQMRAETSTYPRTEWNEDAGVWVEWESVMARFPSLIPKQVLVEHWRIEFQPVSGSSDVRCLIETVGAEYAVGIGATEMDAMIAAVTELRSMFDAMDEGLISKNEKPPGYWAGRCCKPMVPEPLPDDFPRCFLALGHDGPHACEGPC